MSLERVYGWGGILLQVGLARSFAWSAPVRAWAQTGEPGPARTG
jgi:hypothetical protein